MFLVIFGCYGVLNTGQIITHIERLMEDARKEIERIADEETTTDSRG